MNNLIELEEVLQFLHPVKTVIIKSLVLKAEYDDLYYEHKRLKKEPATHENNQLKKLIKTALRKKRNEYDIRHPIKKAGDWTKKIQLLRYYLELARNLDIDLVIDRINLEGCDLRSLNFRTTDEEETVISFTNANLCGANLEGQDLAFIDLQNALLLETNFKDANLYEANFKGANLYEANLEGANLEGSNLFGTNLHRAKLTGTNLKDAYITFDKYSDDY